MFVTSLLSKWVDFNNRRHNKPLSFYERLIPAAAGQTGIPHHIYQICLRGKNENADTVYASLPESFQQNIDFLKHNNPEWTYDLICDREAYQFIRDTYGESVLNYYLKIDEHYGSARADFLRYLLLYEKGGVYLDLKSTLTVSLSDHLGDHDRFLLFYWDNIPGGNRHCLIPDYIKEGEILQGFIVAAPKHPFLRSVILQVMAAIDQYNPYVDGVGWAGVLNVTGPALYTKTIYNEVCQSDSSYDQIYRRCKPFQELGYQVNFYHDPTPGSYQNKLQLKDYRALSLPITANPNKLLNWVNLRYLKLLAKHRSTTDTRE